MILTEANIRQQEPPPKGAKVFYDEGANRVRGLGLCMTYKGTKTWTLDFNDLEGRRRRAVLGAYSVEPVVQKEGHSEPQTLQWARAEAEEWRGKLAAAKKNPNADAEQRAQSNPIDKERWKEKQERIRREEEEQATRAEEQTALTVAQLVEEWPQEIVRTKRERRLKRASTISSEDSILRCHILPAFGERKVADLTSRDVDGLMDRMAEMPTQANRTRSLLHSLMQYAIERGVRKDNPCTGVRHYTENKKERFLSKEEMARLVAAMNAHPNRQSARAIMLMIATGTRRGEVLGARFEEFNPQTGTWTIPAERMKGRRKHIITLLPPVLELLRQMREERPEAEFLFPNVRSEHRPQQVIARFWRSVCKAADLEGVRVHDLRHTFVSRAIKSGVPIAIVSKLVAHSASYVTERYGHLDETVLRQAAEQVGITDELALPAPSAPIRPRAVRRGPSRRADLAPAPAP